MKKYRPYVIIALIITLLYLLMRIAGLGWIEHLELVTLDFRFNIRGEREQSEEVVIVAIDNRSLAQLYSEENNPWPWKRGVYSRIIDRLNQAGAKSIVMDISFDHNNYHDLTGDREFAMSMFSAGNVIIGSYLINNEEEYIDLPEVYRESITGRIYHLNYRYQLLNPDSHFFPITFSTYLKVPPEELFLNSAWAYGIYEIGLPDANGLYHSIPLVINEIYSGQQQHGSSVLLPNIDILGLANYFDLNPGDYAFDAKNNKIILGEHRRAIPVDANGYFNINYYGPRSFKEISVVDLLQKDDYELKEIFADKMVLIGYTAEAKGLVDVRPTPFNKNEAGVQLHATAIQNIIDEDYLRRSSLGVTLLIVFVLFLMASFISLLKNLNLSIIINIVLIIVFNIVNYILFLQGMWFELFYPNFLLVSFLIYSSIKKVYQENKQRLQTKNFFSRYVPESVVNQILADPDLINLGGQEKEISILFCDIIGFTEIAENLTPTELVNLLNEFFTEMTYIIKDQYQGTLDKFIGDAILAIFGAPFSEDDAVRAVKAAVAMKKRAAQLKKEWIKKGEKISFEIGLGISTGKAIVGNVGAPDRMNYTCIGDVVNIGARLESATHNSQYSILINEATYEKVKDYFVCEKVTGLNLKGKKEEVVVYNVKEEK